MTDRELISFISKMEGNCTIKNGVLTFEDGTSIDFNVYCTNDFIPVDSLSIVCRVDDLNTVAEALRFQESNDSNNKNIGKITELKSWYENCAKRKTALHMHTEPVFNRNKDRKEVIKK